MIFNKEGDTKVVEDTFYDYMSALSRARKEEFRLQMSIDVKKTESGAFILTESKSKKSKEPTAILRDRNPKRNINKNYFYKYQSKNRDTGNRESMLDRIKREREEEEKKERERAIKNESLLKEKKKAEVQKEKRAPYLKERKEYFEELPMHSLMDLWSSKEVYGLEDDEINVLKSVIRDLKGINEKSIAEIKPCPNCLMDMNNCACERGWWWEIIYVEMQKYF